MKYIYPALLTPTNEGGYAIRFPDLPGTNSQANSLEEALENAKNALECWIDFLLEENEFIPEPSQTNEIDHDSSEIVTLISADIERFRRLRDNRAVKKTLTIPAWLDEVAKNSNVNFSQTLQKALMEELKIEV